MDINYIISLKVKRFLEIEDITNAELSRRSGVPAYTICRIINGTTPCSLENLIAICLAFNVPASIIIKNAQKELENDS